MNAPPRSIDAPDAFTADAMAPICAGVSMEHGPAMTTSFFPPTFTPATSMTESCGWKARLARLYGSCTRMTLSTHSLLRKSRSSRLVVSPTSPRTTLLEPRLLSTWKPFSRSSSSSLSISVSGAFCFITIIIRIPPLCLQAMLLYCVMASTQKKRSLDQTLRPITAYHHPSP